MAAKQSKAGDKFRSLVLSLAIDWNYIGDDFKRVD